MIAGIPTLEDYDSRAELNYDNVVNISPTEAMEKAHFNPENWSISKALLTMKGDNGQAKLWLHPSVIKPARADGPRFEYEPREFGNNKLWFVVSDFQCPYQDKRAVYELCNLIYRNKPDHLICNGDMIDFPKLSRFDPNPLHDTNVNTGLNATYQVLRDMAEAAGPQCKKYFMPGNHEQRLLKYLAKQASEIYDIKRAETTENILSLPYLLRMDELGYEYIRDAIGEWPLGKLKIAEGLYAKHGWFARNGSGATARAAVEKLGVSLILGHVHRMAKVHVTYPLADRELVGVEGGTMCDLEGGLGFAVEPDWQQGIVAVNVYEDGSYIVDPIEYRDGSFRYMSLR